MKTAGDGSRPAQGQACNTMARVALGLSIFGFIPPLGIAAIVLGHVAESRIPSSAEANGNRVARAALWIAYLQLALVSWFDRGRFSARCAGAENSAGKRRTADAGPGKRAGSRSHGEVAGLPNDCELRMRCAATEKAQFMAAN
jgi:hypothetical protein